MKATPTRKMSSHIGGYTYQFLDAPADNLMCRICHCASREPHLSSCCGHTFCKSCLKGAEQAMAARVCPMCRSEQFAAFANKQADRAVRSLRVFCTNKSKGCQWQGEVNDIINHLRNSDGCEFEVLSCPNNCGITIERRYFTTHVNLKCLRRKIKCQYCHTSGQYLFIESEQHKNKCPKFPVLCPNKCSFGSVPRDVIKEHMKTVCPLQPILCEYHLVGCEGKIIRKDQEKHNKEKMEEHLSLCMYLLNEVNTTQAAMDIWVADISKEQTEKHSQMGNELINLKQELTDALDNTVKSINLHRAMTNQQLEQAGDNKIANLQRKMNKKFQDLEDNLAAEKRRQALTTINYKKQVFYVSFVSVLIVLMAWLLHVNKTPVESSNSKVVKLENDLRAITAELDAVKKTLATCNNQPIKSRAATTDKQFPQQGTYQQHQYSSIFVIDETTKTMIRDKLLEMEAVIFQSISALFGQSHDEAGLSWATKLYSESAKMSSGEKVLPVIIKMSQYSKKYRDDINWFSDPFYIQGRSYTSKLQLNVRAAGDIAYYSTHLSVKVVMVTGEKYQVKHCDVQLLNQISNSKHYSVYYTEESRDSVWKRSDFIANNYLSSFTTTWQYLKDDTIFFRVDCHGHW